ncbi:hypothetical protein BC831DRAFT_470147 [Entophlyctis helioformis]|nr:hypothetical protein BC831DRAFT_470147 [Entophlyctis helioformis]
MTTMSHQLSSSTLGDTLDVATSTKGLIEHPHRIKPSEAGAALLSLSRDLSSLSKRGSVKIAEVQAIAERTWRANVAFEQRLAQLAREKQQLEHMVDTVWKKFDEVIMPLWKFDDSMIPIYEELSTIFTALEALRHDTTLSADARGINLRQLQDRLHAVENLQTDGKFVPGGWSKYGGRIPSGQAMCVNLMNRCYKLVEKIAEMESIVDPSLAKINDKLEDIISNLCALRDAAQAGHPIDPIEVHMYQEQIQAIDNLRVDGKFVGATGDVPEGQAALHELLDWAFDLVHEICVALEEQENGKGGKGDADVQPTVLSALTERVGDVQQSLISYAASASRGITAVSQPTFTLMYDTIGEGMSLLKDTVTHPGQTAYAAASKLRSLVSSSLGYVNRVSAQMEPVDESLQGVHSNLFVIRRTLRQMRDKRNELYINAKTGEGIEASIAQKELRAFNRAFDEQLTEISRFLSTVEAARVDGNFVNARGEVPSGQTALKALLEECYVLSMELLNDACV